MSRTIGRIASALALVALGAALLASPAQASGAGWIEDYQQALRLAKQQNKQVLIDFTGSDWCGWCIKLDKEIFSTQQFKSYAQKNLILLKIDFPQGIQQTAALKKQNAELQAKFKIEGYPTCVVLNPNGAKVGEVGYMEGGPQKFIEALKAFVK